MVIFVHMPLKNSAANQQNSLTIYCIMNNSNCSLVILVDENNNETGTMEKLEAHQKARLHRAISVFICNTEGEWLLQRRALDKYHSNGLWTNACCSHPMPGETAMEAAVRRLKEEMGLKAGLRELFSFTYRAVLDNGLTEHEFDHVFLGITDEVPSIDQQEVLEWRYVSYLSLLEEINQEPERFTVWFRKIVTRVNEYITEISKSQ